MRRVSFRPIVSLTALLLLAHAGCSSETPGGSGQGGAGTGGAAGPAGSAGRGGASGGGAGGNAASASGITFE
jgi:hypothetical protein